jgi:hypothetical protein
VGRLTVSLDAPIVLVAAVHEIYSAKEVAAAILRLDDAAFWTSDGQVELMRVLTSRWHSFDEDDRRELELRLRRGAPRALYRDNAFEDEDEWISVLDSSIYRRLKRIELAGGKLAEASINLLAEISERHPKWRPGDGDRDDFSSWHETRSGPDGHPELLAGIDDRLVEEAMRLQREQHFEEGDI